MKMFRTISGFHIGMNLFFGKNIGDIRKEIRNLGNVNLDSIKEYEHIKERHDFYSEQKKDLEQSIEVIEKLIYELEENMKKEFESNFNKINENFKFVYKRLFGGGNGELKIVDKNNILESDIEITAQPPGKKMKNLNLLSGGEKALTAISILFSIILAKPTPFCILDEIEAPLDDANIFRFGEFLKELSNDTQFISVTHRRGTMEAADYIYGVTMQEKAISKVLSLKLKEAEEIIDAIEKAKECKDKPTAVVCKTIKGKGVSFMENQAEWHGIAPSREQCEAALKELGGEN